MPNNSQGKKQEVEDHHRNFKFSNNKTSVTACNESLNPKTSNVNFVCVTCGKCVLNDNHDICVLHYINDVNSRTKMPMVVPISTTEPTRTMNQSVATPLRKIFTPSGYKWKPKSPIENVNTNVSMPLGNASRTANILEPMTPRDGENLDKMKEKGDACISVEYSTQSRAYRVYNKRTKVIVKTINVNFDELPHMASDHISSDPVPQCLTTALEQDSLSLGPQSQENVPQAVETVTTLNEMDLLFSPMFDELLNGTTSVVSKYSAINVVDAPDKHQQQYTTPSTSTTVAADALH
ncbi:hypothetical protein Tco_0531249 [Tanacetum coccineum]